MKVATNQDIWRYSCRTYGPYLTFEGIARMFMQLSASPLPVMRSPHIEEITLTTNDLPHDYRWDWQPIDKPESFHITAKETPAYVFTNNPHMLEEHGYIVKP